MSLRPTRAAVVSPSGPPSVTLGVLYIDYWQPGYLSSTCWTSTPPSSIFDSAHLACRRALTSAAPDRQTIRQRHAHCSNYPPSLGPGCISGGTQDLSDERLAKQPGLSAARDRDVGSGGWLDGWRTVSVLRTLRLTDTMSSFTSLMHRTRLLESIKCPKQRSKEGNMFLSTQLHDSLHPLFMHACIPRRNSKKNSGTAPSISLHILERLSPPSVDALPRSHPSRTRHPSPSQPEHRRPPRTLA